MPVLSNSMVTRPMDADEIAACGFKTGSPLTDTRTLRHYYRFLPDGCVQIGSRNAITGADAENPKHIQRLQESLHRKFPALTGIDLDYSWWGWVNVSHDMMPRIFQPDPDRRIFYAMGYRRQRRDVLCPGGQAHGPDDCRQGPEPRSTHLYLTAAGPRHPDTFPPPGSAHDVRLVLDAGRKTVERDGFTNDRTS
jgi:hypothetical protein